MFTEKFLEVIGKEGVVSIVSWDGDGADMAKHLEFVSCHQGQ